MQKPTIKIGTFYKTIETSYLCSMASNKSKHQQREELGEMIQQFLLSGGEVQAIARGTSGNESNTNLFKQTTQFEPKPNRTPLTEVVKTLEERKKSKPEASSSRTSRRPKKRLIVDDFGDPVRWVWDE